MAEYHEPESEFDSGYLLIFVGYSQDGLAAAETVVECERDIQNALDKLRRVNSSIPFNRIKFWKWNSDAPAGAGGQALNIHPHLKRADVAVFVFNERVGKVAWEELDFSRKQRPNIPVLPFFPAVPPANDRMMNADISLAWTELLQQKRSLGAGWADLDSNALTPLPEYFDLKDLRRIAYERIEAEVIRVASRYASRVSEQTSVKSRTDQIRRDVIFLNGGLGVNDEPHASGNVDAHELQGNILTISPRGQGRYSARFNHTLREYQGPVLVLDSTGNIYRETVESRKNIGAVCKLDPQSLISDSKADGLNPADVLRISGESQIDSALMLSYLIASGDGDPARRDQSDPFWSENARKLVSGIIITEMMEKDSNDGLLSRTFDSLTQDDVVYNLAVALDTKKEINPIARADLASFLQKTDVTRSGVLSTAQSYLAGLSSVVFQRSIDSSTFDVKPWLSGEPSSIYIIGPVPESPRYSLAYRLWLGTLLHALARTSVEGRTRPLVVADFNQFPNDFPGLFPAMAHGERSIFWPQFPSIGDLRTKMGKYADNFINNCSIVQISRPNNYVSGREISEMTGMAVEEVMGIADDQLIIIESGRVRIVSSAAST